MTEVNARSLPDGDGDGADETTRESRVQRVMRVIQDGRICMPGTCPFCRAMAEAIVDEVV